MNQRGHSDFTGLFLLFILVTFGCLAIEGAFIGLTVILWKDTLWRFIFGFLATVGGIFMIMAALEIWR